MSATVYATIVSLAIFIGLMAVLGAILLLVFSRGEQRVRHRLGQAAKRAAEDKDKAESNRFDAVRERPLFQLLVRRGRVIDQWVDKQGETSRLLIQAGWREEHMRLLFYLLQALIPIVLVGLVMFGGIVGAGKLFQPPLLYMMVFVAVALSMLVPRMMLRSIAARRRRRIRNEVPLFVHMMVMLYDAGLSSRQAFANIVREGAGVLPELGLEIQVVLRQLEAGGDTSESLQSMAKMMEVDDLSSVVGVMRQVDRYGGEIREPLHDVLKVVEERQALDLRERVNVISGRMTMVMLLFFFPSLILFLVGPAFMGLSKAIGGK